MNIDCHEPHENLLASYEVHGCARADKMLGFQRMPAGYALMLDADQLYFFWVCLPDGRESEVHWSKWAVRRGAILDKERLK